PAGPAQPPLLLPEALRTVRGLVRDEQGRPLAKAWVGSDPRPMADTWDTLSPPDRIRERPEPFRDDKGNVVPAGPLGKYFEQRDSQGKWHPIHPDDIKPFETLAFAGDRALTKAEIAKTYSPYAVRL